MYMLVLFWTLDVYSSSVHLVHKRKFFIVFSFSEPEIDIQNLNHSSRFVVSYDREILSNILTCSFVTLSLAACFDSRFY
jgi:hypothetical protein